MLARHLEYQRSRMQAGEISEFPFPVDEARELLAAAPGVELIDDPAANRFPMPTDVTGRDPVAMAG